MTEVKVGKVALSKSKDPAIRAFAERMVADHTKANVELTAIAKAKGIDVEKNLDSEHQQMVDDLSSKNDKDFDEQYSQHMNMDHTKAIELFEAESKASDVELARFAEKTLPTLKGHKKMAEKLPGKTSVAG